MSSAEIVLLLDSDRNTVYQLETVFRRCLIANPLYIVRYSDEAVLYLKGVGVYANRTNYPLPCAILIDVVEAKSQGMEVLKWIRHRPEMDRLPIIAMVNSPTDREIQMAFDAGANAYLLKNVTSEELAETLKSLDFVNGLLRPSVPNSNSRPLK